MGYLGIVTASGVALALGVWPSSYPHAFPRFFIFDEALRRRSLRHMPVQTGRDALVTIVGYTSRGRLGVGMSLEQGQVECDVWTGRRCPKGVLKLIEL